MKAVFVVLSLFVCSSTFAGTSIDKCVEAALDGARDSLAKSEKLDVRKLYVAEKGLLINDDPQYVKTRKELTTLCRRLYIEALDIGD
jgi:hypothetical protein